MPIKREIIGDTLIVDGKHVNLRRESEEYDIERSHGNLLNCKFVPNNDATRMFMSVNFSKAAVPMIHPDYPIISSTYNRDMNEYNFYKKKKPEDYIELHRIHRDIAEHDPRYSIIYETAGKVYLLQHQRHLTFGEGISAYNKTGDGDYIANTNSFSNTGLLCDGLNVMTAYANIIKGIEDSSIISKTYSDRCKYLYVKSIVADVRDNIIFTSLHDDPFPKFNKVKKDNIGIATNSDKNYSSIIRPKLHFNRDKIQYLSSKGYFLGDLNIWYSMDVADNFNHPILTEMIQRDMEYYKNIYKALVDLKISGKILNNTALKFMDDYEYRFIKRAALREGSQEIDKLRLVYYFYKEKTLTRGSKISGDYGDKVTIGYVSGTSEKNPNYRDQFNRIIELIKPSPGIVNRTNSGQLTEHSINFYAFRGLQELHEQNANRHKVESFIVNFVSLICKENAKMYKKRFKEDSGLWKHMRDDLRHIYLKLNPFYYDLHIDTFSKMEELVMSLNTEKFATPGDMLVDIFKGDTFVGRGMVAPLYIRRAKQEGESKESVRSIGDEGSDGNNKKTDNGYRSSNNPVKASEKDKVNQSAVFTRREMRVLEQKDKMKPMIAYLRAMGLKLKK